MAAAASTQKIGTSTEISYGVSKEATVFNGLGVTVHHTHADTIETIDAFNRSIHQGDLKAAAELIRSVQRCANVIAFRCDFHGKVPNTVAKTLEDDRDLVNLLMPLYQQAQAQQVAQARTNKQLEGQRGWAS